MDLDTYKRYRNAPAAIVFFTAKWCGPCKSMYDMFDDLKSRAPQELRMFKVDVDESEEVSAYCEIQSMPTFRFYFEGKLIEIFTRADKDKLYAGYKDLLNKLQEHGS